MKYPLTAEEVITQAVSDEKFPKLYAYVGQIGLGMAQPSAVGVTMMAFARMTATFLKAFPDDELRAELTTRVIQYIRTEATSK